jgi:hypothetical protein
LLSVGALAVLGFSGYYLWSRMSAYQQPVKMSILVCAKCSAESDIPAKDVPTTPLDPSTGLYKCPKCGAPAADLATFRCPKCNKAICAERLRSTAFQCPACKTPFDNSGGE